MQLRSSCRPWRPTPGGRTQARPCFPTGVMDGIVFTDEQRSELHAVEAQIKRRVAIGSHVSERKLIDELVRVGMPENLVRKALLFMASQGDLEHRRERRLIHRLR